jgi:adenine-specific DNA-methyltransferase
MTATILTPRKALNKAYLKIKPNRISIELFKTNLMAVLDSCKAGETEEFHKNLISDFLKQTYYNPLHYVNTKGRNDLVIHTGKDAKSAVGVIIEAKSPTNKTEMISPQQLNNKALQELVLYFMRERITLNNLEIKHLVVTNINEWFVFDAQLFDTLFAHNTAFVKQFNDFEAHTLSVKTTTDFYKQIAEPYINTVLEKLEYAYFDMRKYETIVRNNNKEDDKELIALYKLLSPEHLLKLSFINDSNTLDKNFYNELLHIIGLTETKVGGKKLIVRPQAKERYTGSLLENAILQIESLDKLTHIPNIKNYGANREEQLFGVALELSITWVNRILFLKLLEAQLVSYNTHKNKENDDYTFLNSTKIKDYGSLNTLFFQVLAKLPNSRNADVSTLFAHVPYLNSSLFEPTELEHQTFFVAQLEDDKLLPLLSGTVIKDRQGKKVTGTLNALNYFFKFLDAYDFASEGSEDIQEDNKTLINAAVLGLIFEKINGYKDGSFFTPGFITMYMCKETIRRSVVQKFNDAKGWNCQTFDELQNQTYTIAEGNAIINSLKICDPAVGSGHFLVSALNEIIAIKHELKILADKKGLRLKDYRITVVNDELMIVDEDDSKPFSYNPNKQESQRVQETLFNEKQTIIENCLFGVDINPNSVKICRLRLWIELLKNAYYKGTNELETLPNIDINIKCGNSLISRFGLREDLTKALTQSKWNIESYKLAVDTYRNAENKEQKREMELLIKDIKSNFTTQIAHNDKNKIKLEKLNGELYVLSQQTGLFEFTKQQQLAYNKKTKDLTDGILLVETEIENIKNGVIYNNAFEWRFEFPEVLADNGDFIGFDVVVGNPPYLQVRELNEDLQKGFNDSHKYHHIAKGNRLNLFQYFIGLADEIAINSGFTALIYQNSFLAEQTTQAARKFLFNNHQIISIDSFPERDNENKRVFEDVKMSVCFTLTQKKQTENFVFNLNIWEDKSMLECKQNNYSKEEITRLFNTDFTIPSISSNEKALMLKLLNVENHIKFSVKSGELDMTSAKEYFTTNIKNPLIIKGAQIQKYFITNDPSQGDVVYLNTKAYFKNNSYSGRILDAEKPRIIMQRITGVGSKIRLIMTYVESTVFCVNSTNYIVESKVYNLKFLLSVLNSKLINYYFKTTSTNTNVTNYELEKVLIPIISDTKQKPFIKLVDKILALKATNPKADTTKLEQQLDDMIYKLYELTPNEIAIVEK